MKNSGQKPCDDEKSSTFAADISREFGTTIRQVRAEAYRFSTTAARISRQIFLFAYLYFNLIVKFTTIDEVGDGKFSVFEQVVKGLDQMKVFGQLLVEAFVPVGRRTIQPNEVVKGLVGIPL